jgi:hypothetical protein
LEDIKRVETLLQLKELESRIRCKFKPY